MTIGPGAASADPEQAITTRADVWTVTGRVAADDLGLVVPHEHLVSDVDTPVDTAPGWARVGREFPDGDGRRARYEAPLAMNLLGEISLGAPNRDNWRLDDREHARADLAAFAANGGTTLVELTTPDTGRDPAALRALAAATGVTVVMGCGWHHPAWVDAGPAEHAALLRDPDAAADHLVRELTDGVEVAGAPEPVRAAVIGAIAALDPSDETARAILVACARASARTGAPIWLERHADPRLTRDALSVLADSGADPARVALGACDPLAPDPDAVTALLEHVGYVAFDHLGRLPSVYSDHDDQDVASALFALAQRGQADRVLLSHGISAKSDLLAWGGGGYAFLPQQFVPMLRMFGTGMDSVDDLVRTLTVGNPRRWLTGEPAPGTGTSSTGSRP